MRMRRKGEAVAAVPWRPSVGDRVRIRDGIGVTLRCIELPHDPAEQGHTGVVMNDRPYRSFVLHWYLVVFDEPVPALSVGGSPMPLQARHYAADELEPIA
jgi:hypothetical protein